MPYQTATFLLARSSERSGTAENWQNGTMTYLISDTASFVTGLVIEGGGVIRGLQRPYLSVEHR